MEEFDKSSLYYVDSTPEGMRYSLYDTASWKNGLAFKNIDFSESGLPVIKIAELNNGISSSTAYTDKTYSQDVFLTKGDYVFSWSGNPETSIDIYKYNLPDGWLNQHIFKVTPKTEIIDKGFFFYLMKFLKPYFKKIATNKQTTGLGHVTISDLQRMSVALPPLPTQQRIAAILSSLDDKIELNNKINTNLEQQAQALFKNWFVDFEPFGGKMPEGWKVGKLSEIGTIVGGSTPSKAKKEYYTNNGIAWITPKDLSNDKSKFISHGETDITELGFENSSAIKMPKGTILYSSRAPIGYIAIAKNEVTTNQGFKSVIPNPNVGNAYIYYFLKSNFELIDTMASGSTFKEISGTAMKNVPVLIPDDKSLSSFQSFCNPVFTEQEKLEAENKILVQIRDTLLPKLMNGEIIF
ncbi:MAG: restriction endonuclease subunit S [Treponema sp.]|nr:restriction endonuclease subunit S [Treponema sp.]